SGKEKRKNPVAKRTKHGSVITLKSIVAIVILIVAVLFVAFSIDNDLTYATNPTPMLIKDDWVETMNWLGANTPDPGVDYYGTYNSSFEYPTGSYGVMVWWDYGHYVTFLAKRLPITNPFQDNLKGKTGASAFFLSQNESDAIHLLERFGGRYVITDTDLVTRKFDNIPQWYDPEADIAPFKAVLYIPDHDDPTQLVAFEFIRDAYYQSMVTRLQLFDGSMKEPGTGYYLELEDRKNLAYPVVTTSKEMGAEEGRLLAAGYNQRATSGDRAEFLSARAMNPVSTVAALRHFRLIHESPGNSSSLIVPGTASGLREVPMVKVFESVSGAKIKGEGTIALLLVTNTGREFEYRQKSTNGEFIVPYSTIDNPYGVRTIGNYRVVETNQTIDVTEQDVLEGREVKI
ncbi:MAG: oligosaccharyl transferase, archaeosortase A system-associated, partial [Methanolinea sp.]|nr:oligosaccharyl transferase, archaeosortase A system-associated [Methanolinea sp.]